ncbi:unnamed protein product [Mycena citricolor]|uniref:Aip3p/Bud6 N-terminal domain-containing protein n=1 Tax=Mycena citricolor TaxID=2018698 RepID=A0AAD2H9U3_9AGAR|nr:unnamed protein product [Mycena citricolor]
MQDDGNPSVPAYRRSTSSSNTSDGSQGGHVFSPVRAPRWTLTPMSAYSPPLPPPPPPPPPSPPRSVAVSHPAQQAMPGDVSTSVHNLLLATKQLQAVLEQWSVGRASETDVSDVYVQIGTDFNTAVQAFAYHRIDLRCACPRAPRTPSQVELTRALFGLGFAFAATSTACRRSCARRSSRVSRRTRRPRSSPRPCPICARRSSSSCAGCSAASRSGAAARSSIRSSTAECSPSHRSG